MDILTRIPAAFCHRTTQYYTVHYYTTLHSTKGTYSTTQQYYTKQLHPSSTFNAVPTHQSVRLSR